jgi:glycosyltransferase involved in cell wall biosynthesis
MKIQAISTMRNEASNIVDFVRTIEHLRRELGIELSATVVDNGSTDDSQTVIRQLSHLPYLKFLRNPENSSYADGIELALANCNSEYVLFIPGDMQFHLDDISLVLRHFLLKYGENGKKPFAIFTSRSIRNDGHYSRIRGIIWKKFCCNHLKISQNLDPASQLRIIPNRIIDKLEARNFIWDIECLLKTLDKVHSYDVVDVSFHKRIRGRSSLDKRPWVPVIQALTALYALKKA